MQSLAKQSLALESRSIRVSPTSSTRTLCVGEARPPHALKVHFPFRVSRYGRKMRDEVVQQGVNVSREMEAGCQRLDPDQGLIAQRPSTASWTLRPYS